MIPPGRRLPGCRKLVDNQAYFVVHAPRQTGKTTAMRALARLLLEEGRYAALHFSCETARVFPDDVEEANRALWWAIEEAARIALPEGLRPAAAQEAHAGVFLQTQLARWAQGCPLPLVLIFDEIDSLAGSALISVLSQLRAGFDNRPSAAPWSVILCGMRDVRDYKVASGGGPVRVGSSSPFNIKEQSLRLSNFEEAEVRELYGQHTAEAGQLFAEEALARAWELSRGQPWLVNALAREIVDGMGVPPTETITAAHVEEAKERLILARATHLDSLVARLLEPRVRRVIEPLLAGSMLVGDTYDDDAQYVRDLGLVAPGKPLAIANPIYREVIVRVLSASVEDSVTVEPRRSVRPDGTLDFRRLLEEFADFWREHGEVLETGLPYHEVAPQLVLMAYLQRVINGGGYIDRECGVGRGRIDLLVRWPYLSAEKKREWQREAVELKVWRGREKDPLAKGLVQLDGYLERLGLPTGVLVIFDRRPSSGPPEARTRFEEAVTPAGRSVTVLRG